MKPQPHFCVYYTIHGSIISNTHDHFHPTALGMGTTHIEPELAMIYEHVDKLEPGSIIVDGGTNAGLVLIPLAQRTKHKNIALIGFEPQRVMHAAVSGSIVLNGLWETTRVINAALSDKCGELHMHLPDYTSRYDFGTVRVGHTQDKPNVFRDNIVKAVTLDSLELPRLDFLKLDVEAHELHALRGAMGTIMKFRPVMWIEFPLVGLSSIRNMLIDYTVTDMDGTNCLCTPN